MIIAHVLGGDGKFRYLGEFGEEELSLLQHTANQRRRKIFVRNTGTRGLQNNWIINPTSVKLDGKRQKRRGQRNATS